MDRHEPASPITPSSPAPSTAWGRNLRRTALLLAIWFLVGPVLGILLVEPLNELSLGGIPLGFWVSQQGSIYVFIVLIFVYAVLGDRADRESEARAGGSGSDREPESPESRDRGSGPAGDPTERGR